MAVYLITYDLHKAKGKNYDDVHAKIKTFGPWWHHLESTWLVDTNLSAKQMSMQLRQVVANEEHLIIRFNSQDYYGSLDAKAWDWISQRIGGTTSS